MSIIFDTFESAISSYRDDGKEMNTCTEPGGKEVKRRKKMTGS